MKLIILAAVALVSAAACQNKQTNRQYDENLVVLLSDMHLNPNGHQPEKCAECVSDILKMNPLPKNVITFGDLAYLTGKPDEYAKAKAVFQPLEDAGIEVTHGMGNHDRRENFALAFPEKAAKTKLNGKMVFIIQTTEADFIMMDSLNEGEDTTKWITAGTMDAEQAEWLDTTLSAYQKPVFVCSHHPIEETQLRKIITNYPVCKGYIYGHNHKWNTSWVRKNYKELTLVRTLCLPSTGHWGDIGYTVLKLDDEKAVASLVQKDFYTSKPLADSEIAPASWAEIRKEHKNAVCTFLLK